MRSIVRQLMTRCVTWGYLGFLMAVAFSAQAASFYVSPSGKDGNPGTFGKPFATLPRAQAAVRTLTTAGLQDEVTVYLRGGRYQLDTPVTFTPADGGNEQDAVTYMAYGKEVPVISGGVAVTGWRREGAVWTAAIPGVRAGHWYPRQLFINGERRQRARLPYQGFYQGLQSADGKMITFPDGQLQHLGDGADVEFTALVEWTSSHQHLPAFDADASTLAFPRQALPFVGLEWAAHIEKNIPHFPYFFDNVAGKLDPGEWYLDRVTGVLRYRPLPGEGRPRQAVVPRLTALVEVLGTAECPVRNLRFSGLQFADTDWVVPAEGYAPSQAGMDGSWWNPRRTVHEICQPSALRFMFAQHCTVDACRVVNIGGNGISLEEGCRNNIVQGNEITEIGGNGIQVGKFPFTTPPEERVADNVIANNYIHRCAVLSFSCVGIWAGINEHLTIAHNEICDLPYTGISIGWSWDHKPTAARNNIVEYNHIHHVTQLMADGGGIYTLGAQPESLLRGNVIHDVQHVFGVAGTNGIFHDNGSEGWRRDANIFYRISDDPVRYNLSDTHAGFFSIGQEYKDIAPGAPDFPQALASRAGLAPAYRATLVRQQVQTHLEMITPATHIGGSWFSPMTLRLVAENTGSVPARGTVSANGVPLVPSTLGGAPSLTYRLAPGARAMTTFTVLPESGWAPHATLDKANGTLPLVLQDASGHVSWTSADAGKRGARILRYRQADQTAIAQGLSKQQPFLFEAGTQRLGALRLCVAGDTLAVRADITDRQITMAPNFWEGSALELFFSRPDDATVQQIVLVPSVGEQPGRVLHYRTGQEQPTPAFRWQSVATPDGYCLTACIPLALLGIAPGDAQFELEAGVTARPTAGQPAIHGSLFHADSPFLYDKEYGTILVTDR